MMRYLSEPVCFYSLLFSLIFCTSCHAQNKPEPKETVKELQAFPAGKPKVTKTQGTSQYANIYCSLRDKSGNLWFGTPGEGVYRYDGRSFVQFTVKEGLCNNHVLSMLEDTAGNIWFGTAYGICRFNGKNFTPVSILIPGRDFSIFTLPNGKFKTDLYGVPVLDNTVWSIMQDKRGILWFGTATGVYCYNGISFTRFTDNSELVNRDSVHLKMVDHILQDRDGNIWFCSGMLPGDEGICRYDGKSIIRFKPNGEGWIRKVIESKDGNLYFATRHNGVLQYDGKNFTNITEKAGIDNGSVSTIAEDRAGNLWIGTELGSGELGEDGGVWRYDRKVFTRFTTQQGLVHNGVFSIVEDQAGNLWFGTRNIGLSRYDGRSFTSFSE